KRKSRSVDDVVEQPHGYPGGVGKAFKIDTGFWRERRPRKACQIQRAEIAGPVRGQRDFTAGICGSDPLAVPEIVEVVDTVDEEYAGLGVIIRRLQNAIPKLSRRDTPNDAAGHRPSFARPFSKNRLAVSVAYSRRKYQRPFGIAAHRRHESIRHLDRQVEPAQLSRLL